MAFDLSFTQEFFFGEGYDYDNPPPKSELPTSVLQALVSMDRLDWEDYCQEELHVGSEASTALPRAMKRIRGVDTCTSLSSPVEVWLEGQGHWTLMVYSARDV